jgi:hypothetical protein
MEGELIYHLSPEILLAADLFPKLYEHRLTNDTIGNSAGHTEASNCTYYWIVSTYRR